MSTANQTTALARKRDLWWQFTVRAVELRHRGSYLGAVWTVLNPLLSLTLYAVVFGVIFGGAFFNNFQIDTDQFSDIHDDAQVPLPAPNNFPAFKTQNIQESFIHFNKPP